MSFSAVATYTTDKSADMFGQSGFEELSNDFFDQFITYSPLEDTTPEYSLLPDTSLERSMSDQSGDSSFSSTDDEKHNGPWRGEAWAHSAASLPISGSQFYSELTGRAAISDSELLSLENINLESPLIPALAPTSLPPSPSPNATLTTRKKNRIVESLSKTLNRATASLDKRLLRGPIRKSSSSPTMMRAQGNKSSRELQLEDFDFELQANILPLSPPPSAKAPNAFQESDMMAPAKGKLLNGFSYNRNTSTNLYDTPSSTPILEAPSSRVVSQDLSGEIGLYPITPQSQNVPATWSQLPNSQEFANLDTNAMYPDLESPFWYGANTTTIAQPSPSGFHTNPQRATKSLAMQLQNDLAFSTNDLQLDPIMHTGLGIQMPIAQQFIMGSSPILQQGYFASPNQNQPHLQQRQQGQTQPHLQQRQSQSQSQNLQHQRQISGGNRHFSNGSANGAARPRLQHQGPYHNQNQHQSQNLGQSHSPIRRPNPRPRSRSPNSSSPSPTPFTVRKRRSTNHNPNNKSSNKAEKTSRGGAAMVVDFVNYTPSDSRKILTGVAPSGSSKTKARREKEALEKRRRLSQAAVKAVRAAGGSLESLGEFIV
jgi:hypothetical protein